MHPKITGTPSMIAIMVLYKMDARQSPTLRSLESQLSPKDLLIYDNSPEPASDPTKLCSSYRHDADNGGLKAAYHWAMVEAQARDADWLLLLDQDTALPEDYVETFRRYASLLGTDTVALIPTVHSGGEIVSPKAVFCGIPGIGDLPATRWGIQRQELSAINSGCFVRLSYLREVGGFRSWNKLDGVDRLFFDRIYKDGKNVFLLPTSLGHELSLSNLSAITPARWASISDGEREFFQRARPPHTRALASGLMLWRALSPRTKLSFDARKTTLKETGRLLKSLFGNREVATSGTKASPMDT